MLGVKVGSYNSGNQNESLSPMTSGIMHSGKADARSLLTNYNLNSKDIHCMQQQPMQGREKGRKRKEKQLGKGLDRSHFIIK